MNTFRNKHHWLNTLDPRIKVFLCSILGVLTWHVSPYGLALYGGTVLLTILQAELFTHAKSGMLRSYARFIVFWMLLVFIVELITTPFSPETFAAIAGKVSLLGARLTLLILLGLILVITASSRQLGLALAWFLRPVFGKNSWQIALALALMIHFIPLVQQTAEQVRYALRLRTIPRNSFQRFLIIPQAILRILSQKTWHQTVAVAARGLDTPESWSVHPPCPPVQIILGICIASAAGAALLI